MWSWARSRDQANRGKDIDPPMAIGIVRRHCGAAVTDTIQDVKSAIIQGVTAARKIVAER